MIFKLFEFSFSFDKHAIYAFLLRNRSISTSKKGLSRLILKIKIACCKKDHHRRYMDVAGIFFLILNTANKVSKQSFFFVPQIYLIASQGKLGFEKYSLIWRMVLHEAVDDSQILWALALLILLLCNYVKSFSSGNISPFNILLFLHVQIISYICDWNWIFESDAKIVFFHQVLSCVTKP